MSFQKGSGDNTLLFPFTQSTIDNLLDCSLASPRVGDANGIKIPDSFNIQTALTEVQGVRAQVVGGAFPRQFFIDNYPFDGAFPVTIPEPLVNEGLSFSDPKGLANVVHMDLPTDMPFAVHQWLLSQGCKVVGYDNRYNNFLASVPDVINTVSTDIKEALDKAFAVKYYYGLIRPEEIFASTANADDILLTHYPEGCPTHPSFVAGHGAAAGGGVKSVLDQFENLTDEQIKVALDCAYIWAQNRTLAGVHYSIDNVGGLIVGGLGSYMRPEVVAEYTI